MGFKISKIGKGMKKLSFGSIGATIIIAVVGTIFTELMEILVKDFVREIKKGEGDCDD